MCEPCWLNVCQAGGDDANQFPRVLGVAMQIARGGHEVIVHLTSVHSEYVKGGAALQYIRVVEVQL